MRPLFDTLGLEYDKANRARVDEAIREIIGADGDARCPEVWAMVKALTPEQSAGLPGLVAERLG
jgi:hypothetical protein